MTKSFLFACCLLCLCSQISAQENSLQGLVLDNQVNAQPLSGVSLQLLSAKDASVIANTLSNKKGTFIFTNIIGGKYFLKIAYLGYTSQKIDTISIADGQAINLDKLIMLPLNKLMNEITITGKKYILNNKLDRQTYKADQFESAKGGSALDVLKNLPSVSINGQGDISVRGTNGSLVLVDGKPVLSDAATVLSQLPSNMVANVELLTAPSAKYDADGKGGIINIVTKRANANGISLAANLQGGLPSTTDFNNKEKPQRFGGDISLNIKKKKWDITASANYLRNDGNGRREGDVFTRNLINNTLTHFPSFGERSFDKYNYAAKLALMYAPDANNNFSAGFFVGKKFQVRRADLVYHNSTTDAVNKDTLHQLVYYNSNVQTKVANIILANLDYSHTFKNKSTIAAAAQFERAHLTGNTQNLNLNYPAMDKVFQEVRNPYSNPINSYRLKLDHTIALGSVKLESGYQYRYDQQDGVFDYVITPATNQTDIARFNGSATTNNLIQAVYTQVSGKLGQLQYTGGLRFETADRAVKLSYETAPHVLKIATLFPSVNLLYGINASWNAKAGYSKRVQRNNNFELNPIPEREHSETLEQGDPNLLPQMVDLAELGINHSFKGGSYFVTLYYQRILHPLQRVNSVYADTILNRVFTNAERAKLLGVELGSTMKPAKWWTLYAGANLYQYTIDGRLDVLGIKSTVVNAAWVYSINANSSFNLGAQWTLQANVNYTSNKPTAQGEDSRFLVPNSSLKKAFLQGKCAISLQWQNMNMGLFHANQQRITTKGTEFFTTTNYIYETDIFLLNFSINLNKWSSKNKLPASEIGEKEF